MTDPPKHVDLATIREALEAEVVSGGELVGIDVNGVYASDLMSDVLAYGKANSVLLTGLCTKQAVISAFVADFKAIVFLRGKKIDPEIVRFAEEKGIAVLSTQADMYEACVSIGSIYVGMPVPGGMVSADRVDDYVTTHRYCIEGKDFACPGLISTQIKGVLMSIGYNPQLVRRVAISAYEAEMNVVMHAIRGVVNLTAGHDLITVVVQDEGKGIPDIEMAMQEGFSTATEEMRAMGFGAGMGLPNIKKNSDFLDVTSELGKGTRLEMRFQARAYPS